MNARDQIDFARAQLLRNLVLASAGRPMKQIRDLEPGGITGNIATWPSGVHALDQIAHGFARFSVIAGAPKVGKSMLATRSALDAAAAGWHVIYLSAENPDDEENARLTAYFGHPPPWPDWFYDRVAYRRVLDLTTTRELAEEIASHITELDQRSLVVFDSANRLAKFIQTAQPKLGYFRILNDITRIAARIANESRHRLAALLVSEQNRRGEAVGMDIEYSADRILYVDRDDSEKYVRMRLASRSSPGGFLGVYARDVERCRFTLVDLSPRRARQPAASRHRPDLDS